MLTLSASMLKLCVMAPWFDTLIVTGVFAGIVTAFGLKKKSPATIVIVAGAAPDVAGATPGVAAGGEAGGVPARLRTRPVLTSRRRTRPSVPFGPCAGTAT